MYTYSSDRLHAENKSVLGEVARVAQSVLLPQLAKKIVHATHVPEVVGKVALKERVYASAQDEPHDGSQVRGAGIGAQTLDHDIRYAEDGDASSREHEQQVKRARLVGQVANNLLLYGVVRMRARGHRRIGFGHGCGRRKCCN